MSTPRAVLFDLDGTLIDTMGAFADVAADVLVLHHGRDRSRSHRDYLRTSGIPFFRQLELIAPGDTRNRAAAAEFEERKLLATTDVRPSPATIEALTDLRESGIAIAVCSNNFQEQVDVFVNDHPGLFDLALGFGGGLAKGPTQFARASAAFECGLDDLVFVGDSVIDAELAIATGLRFVGKLGTFSASDFECILPSAPVINEISELLYLFD